MNKRSSLYCWAPNTKTINILCYPCEFNWSHFRNPSVQDFGDCYAALGLPPETEWDALRAHYRRLIRQWHPDRFSGDSAQQRLAEERSKQITAAYHALETYRRDHGVLPPAGAAGMRAEDQKSAWRNGPAFYDAESIDAAGARTSDAAAFNAETGGGWRWRRAAISLAVLVPVLYLLAGNLDVWTRKGILPDEGVAEPGDDQLAPRLADRPGEQRGITLGSTIVDVYAIQGIPTARQGDTWYYGRSQVHFAQGAVVSWDEDSGNPLRIARNQRVQMRTGNFKFGSTKDEVRAIQGTPVTETATVWDYGLSRVYFENNRVVKWEESPMQRLRVPR